MSYMLSGLGVAGLVCGYLVGASNTPVVGAALPILGGVVMTAFSIHRTKVVGEELKVIKDLHESAHVEAIRQLAGKEAVSSRTIGMGMLVFLIPMILGVLLGSHVRTHGIFLPKPAIFHPVWQKTNTKPTSIDQALEWMKLSNTLSEGGLKEEDIVYVLNLSNQKEEIEIGAPQPTALAWDELTRDAKTVNEAMRLMQWHRILSDSGIPPKTIKHVLSLPFSEDPLAAASKADALALASALQAQSPGQSISKERDPADPKKKTDRAKDLEEYKGGYGGGASILGH